MEGKTTADMVAELVDRYTQIYGLTPHQVLHQIRADAKDELERRMVRKNIAESKARVK